MSRRPLILAIVLLITTCLIGPTTFAQKTTPRKINPRRTAQKNKLKNTWLLRNDKLDRWGYFLVPEEGAKKQPTKSDVWSIDKGVLTCKGTPMGYLFTQKNHKKFRLSFQWRWPEGTEPTNSGVFLRITGKDQALPKCIEVQLCHKKAGDLIGFHGITIPGPANRLVKKESPIGGKLTILSKTTDAELPPGKWNRGTITVEKDKIFVWINGKLVNRVTGIVATEGRIGLQSEGGPIEFRKVILSEVVERSARPRKPKPKTK